VTLRRSRFFFDTNVYRKLAQEGVNVKEHPQKRIVLSFITYIELLEQIQTARQKSFDEVKNAIALARKHGKKGFLLPPIEFVQKELFNQPGDAEYVRQARRALDLAVRLKQLADRNQAIKMHGYRYWLGDFGRPRRDFQRAWVNALRKMRTRFLAEAGVLQEGRAVITGKNASLVNAFVSSPRWYSLYAQAICEQLDPSSVENRSVRISEAMNAAATFMGSILRKVVVDGYDFERKANDSNDHGQLQYLCAPDMFFVTDDGPLLDSIRGSSQFSNVLTRRDFLTAMTGIN